LPVGTAKFIKQLLVSQGEARKLLAYPSTPAPKPSVTSVPAIAQGDSKWITVTGANLASIRTVVFNGNTELKVQPDAAGTSVRIFITASVTATAGSKEIEMTNAAGDKVTFTLKVDPR
jgi:hypothetical protein